MGKMYTLKPDESINDHMKDSMDIINHIVELSISCMRDLSNPHEGTYVDMTYNKFMRALEHIRNTIEMLDELTDELEDREDEVRCEYEERVVRFFNNWMNSNMSYEYKSQAEEAVKRIHEIENHYMSEIQKLNEDLDYFRDLAISRSKELEKEREKSNQLEEKNHKIKNSFELAKKYLRRRREEISRIEEHCKNLEHQLKEEHERYMKLREAKEHSPAYWEKHCKDLETQLFVFKNERDLAKKLAKRMTEENHIIKKDLTESELSNKALIEVLNKKYDEIESLTQQLIDSSPNNPQNFCGNCKHFEMHAGDVGVCARFEKQKKYKVVDPDDASCPHFECHKPDQPCCKDCNRDDCDDCTLCPF